MFELNFEELYIVGLVRASKTLLSFHKQMEVILFLPLNLGCVQLTQPVQYGKSIAGDFSGSLLQGNADHALFARTLF